MLSVRVYRRIDTFQIKSTAVVLGVRIDRWNDREDNQREIVIVVGEMDRTERNCRCVGGRGLAEKNC